MKKYTVLYWFILLFVILLQVSHAHGPSPELVRRVREVCPHGSYDHEGTTCCLCAAGQYLTKHCMSSPDDRKCEQCKEGTFNSDPNNQETCLPCTSCSHEIAYLEVAEECAVNRNARCRCKTDHYCSSFSAGTCAVCDPCTTCNVDGIKEACTEVKDTVCGGGKAAIIVVFVSLLVIGIVVVIVLWKKGIIGRGRQRRTPTDQTNGTNSQDVAMQPLRVPDVELQPLLPDMSDVLGWKDMKYVAMCSGISDAVIDSCKLDHQGDTQEQTLQLLKKWVERHGRDSAPELLRILEKGEKRATAERIRDILTRAASSP